MPKTHPGSRYLKNYAEEDVQNALKAMTTGMSLRQASREFGVPRATLQFRESEKFNKIGFRSNPVVSKGEEDTLVKWIVENMKKAFQDAGKTFSIR